MASEENIAKLQVRPMEEGDLEDVARLERENFADSWSLELLRSGMKSPWDIWMICQEKGLVVGYGVLRILGTEGEIQRIVSDLGRRRQGIGRRLLEAMIKIARDKGAGELSLEVRESNQSARKLYESYGFCQEAVRKGYYQSPQEDALIMWNREI